MGKFRSCRFLSYCQEKGGSCWSSNHNCYKLVETTTTSTLSCPTAVSSIRKEFVCHAYVNNTVCLDGCSIVSN